METNALTKARLFLSGGSIQGWAFYFFMCVLARCPVSTIAYNAVRVETVWPFALVGHALK